MDSDCRQSQVEPVRRALRLWYKSVLGATLLENENRAIGAALQDLFGYYLLQLGQLTGEDLLAESRIRHRVVIDNSALTIEQRPDLYAELDAVPVRSDSVDVVLLHHTLEFESDPHQVLREVDRMLVPEGHVVIVAFNPWSLWGVARLLRRRKGRTPWCGKFLGFNRLEDWVGLLGFDVVDVHHVFFRPPWRHEGVMRRLQFMEKAGARWWPVLAGANVIVAKKRVATLTPIKMRWRLRRPRVSDVAEPSSGRMRSD